MTEAADPPATRKQVHVDRLAAALAVGPYSPIQRAAERRPSGLGPVAPVEPILRRTTTDALRGPSSAAATCGNALLTSRNAPGGARRLWHLHGILRTPCGPSRRVASTTLTGWESSRGQSPKDSLRPTSAAEPDEARLSVCMVEVAEDAEFAPASVNTARFQLDVVSLLLGLLLLVTIKLARSYRLETSWKNRFAAPGSKGK